MKGERDARRARPKPPQKIPWGYRSQPVSVVRVRDLRAQ